MKVVAKNRRAKFDYDVLETVEAGIILTGQEVKSCRLGHVDLAGAYVSLWRGSAVLRNAKIQPYRFASNLEEYDPAHDRTLLLKKRERTKLESFSEQQGVTVIPLEVRAGRYIKVLLAVARGRKTFDKRRKIREKEITRRLRRGEEVS